MLWFVLIPILLFILDLDYFSPIFIILILCYSTSKFLTHTQYLNILSTHTELSYQQFSYYFKSTLFHSNFHYPYPFLPLSRLYRIVLSTIQFGAVGTVASTVAFGPEVSIPFFVGSLAGAFYLYLLGKQTDSIGAGEIKSIL